MKIAILLCLVIGAAFGAQAQSVRLKDLARVSAQRENALVGYGVVTGLSGSGDSARSKATRVTLSNLLNRFDLAIASDDIASRNVAVVMVTASLPAYARPGDHVDVGVSSWATRAAWKAARC
jgi:flagellar P-ring protein precursor FlgI